MNGQYNTFENYLRNNEYDYGDKEQMELFNDAELDDLTRARAFIIGQRLQLIVHEANMVERRLTKHATFLEGITDRSVVGELRWIHAQVAYLNGEYEKAQAILRKLESQLITADSTPLRYENMLLCRVYLLLGKVLLRRRDTFMATVFLSLSAYHCHQSVEYRGMESHYLTSRISIVFCRVLLAEKTPQPTMAIIDGCKASFGLTLPNSEAHLFMAEIEETKGLLAGLIPEYSDEYEKATHHYDNAVSILDRVFNGKINRRTAHIKRLEGYQLCDKVWKVRKVTGADISPRLLKHLERAEEIFVQELKTRKELLPSKHPTIARLHNNLSFVYRYQALYYHGESNAGEAHEEKLFLARFHVKEAIDTNHQHVDGVKKPLNDSQYMVTLKRRLELIADKWDPMEYSSRDYEEELVEEAWSIYLEAYNVARNIERGFATREPKDTFYARLRPIQERILDILYKIVNNEKKKSSIRRDAKSRMLKVFLHSKRTIGGQPVKRKESESDIDVPEDRRRIKWFSKRLMQEHNCSMTEIKARFSEPFFDSCIKMLGNYASNYEKLVEGHQKSADTEALPPSAQDIINGFDTEHPGAIISYFVGDRHLYAFYLASGGESNKARSHIYRLTEEKFTDAFRTNQVAVLMKKCISCFFEYSEVNEQNGRINTNPSPGLQREINKLAAGAPDIFGGEVLPDLMLLELSRRLYDRLIRPIEVGSHIKRLYIIPDTWQWQRVPYGMLFDFADEVSDAGSLRRLMGGTYASVRDHFLGYRYQLATIPSLIDLYLLRKRIEDKQTGKKKTANFFLSHGTSKSDEKGHDRANSVHVYGREILNMIEHDTAMICYDLLKRKAGNQEAAEAENRYIHDYSKSVDELKSSSIGVRVAPMRFYRKVLSEPDPIKIPREADVSFFYGHSFVDEDNENERLLEIVPEATSPTGAKYHFRTIPKYLSREEIAHTRLWNAELVVIMSCGTVMNDSHHTGDMPLGIFSALLEAGASASVGTLYEIELHVGAIFSVYFMRNLFGRQEEDNAVEGSIPYSQILHNYLREALGKEDRYAHPLNWGAFVIMGDMTRAIADNFDLPSA